MELREILGEELYKQVKEKLGDKKLGVINDGSWMPKQKLDEKIEEVKLLKEKVTSYEKQVNDTTALLKDSADLKAKFEALQTESKTQLEARDKQISNIVKKTALKQILQEKGARYPDLLLKEFDVDTLEMEGETVKNFDSLLNPLKEKYGDMFVEKKVAGTQPAKGQTKEPASFDEMDLGYMDKIK